MDAEPQPGFGDHEIAILEDLARMAVGETELRSTTERSRLELDQRKQADKIMRASHEELERRVEQRTADLTWAVNVCELLSEDGRMLIRAGCGFTPGIVGRTVVESGRHTRGYAPDHAEPVFVEHFGSDPACRLAVRDGMEQVPIGAVSVLIQAAGRPFGTLCAFSAESRRFSEQDVTFL